MPGARYRRFGAAGIRRRIRAASLSSGEVLPWSGFEASGLLFLDAKLQDTITIDTGVSLWADQSDQGNDQAMSTTSRQPANSTDGGQESVLFDGIDDYMQCSGATGFPVGSGGSLTTFVVARWVSVAGGNRGMLDISDLPTTTNRGISWFTHLASGNLRYRASVGQSQFLFSDTTNRLIFEGTHKTADRTQWLNGVLQNTESVSRTLTASLDEIILGALAGPLSHFSGHVHSVLIFNGELSADDRLTIRSRLANRWGITL